MKLALLATPGFKDLKRTREILELRGWSITNKNPDYVLAIGGDGSVLYSESKFPGTPIISIKYGKLGFLSCEKLDNLETVLKAVETGNINIETRNKVEYTVGKRTGSALNDIVVTQSSPGRSLRINVKIDKSSLGTFVCDGIVFSTPTGSTGYNLSCGGPVVEPGQELMVLSLINPHLSRLKSMVLPASRTIELCFEREVPAPAIVVDGGKPIEISPKQAVKLTGSRKKARLVRLRKDYFSKLGEMVT